MRRAVRSLTALAACVALVAIANRPASSQDTHAAIDGMAMVDYSKAPNFEVGTWVKYHTVVRGATGYFQEYWTTLIVTGEEKFWGERGFWLETVSEDPGDHPKSVASFVSYDAFGDSLSALRPTWFQRKHVREFAPNGEPIELVQRRDANELKLRASQRGKLEIDPNRPPPVYDTLGVDTTMVPLGTWRGPLFRERRQLTDPRATADSTIEVYRREVRVRRMGDPIPITRMVREDVVEEVAAKHWKTGVSAEAKERLVERAVATTTVVGFGKGNHPEPVATPKRARGKRLPPEPAKAGSTSRSASVPKSGTAAVGTAPGR